MNRVRARASCLGGRAAGCAHVRVRQRPGTLPPADQHLGSAQHVQHPSTACQSSSDASTSQAIGKLRPIDDVVDEDAEETWSERLERYTQVTTGAAALLLVNEGIRRLFVAQNIGLSPPLAGMIATVVVLGLLKGAGQGASDAVDSTLAFFEPLRNWIARWMPIFFAPSLIVLPRAAASIAQGDMVKMIGVTVVGWFASMIFALVILRTIRNTAHSDITTDEEWETSPHPVNPFSTRHYLFWGFVNLLPLAVAPALRGYYGLCGAAFLFASTIKGYLYGVALPNKLKTVLHPIIFCFLYSTACMALWAYLTQQTYFSVLDSFLPTAAGALGPGSVLMKMLAVVVLCDGQRVFLQRKIVKHHFLEIIGTIVASSLFSIFLTAFAAAKVGLAPTLAKSLVPRSITVALALPMTEALGGSASVTAALVCVTGLVGAALGQQLMNMMNVNDEISRGVAMGATAHGLGASAVAASEPQALPFSAVTIAIMGTVSNLLLCVPAVRGAILAICGA